MRIFILQNCVVAGSVWMEGEEVHVDEAVGGLMVEQGVGREMTDPVNSNGGTLTKIEFATGKRESHPRGRARQRLAPTQDDPEVKDVT